jgi:hypothetical protein
MIINKDNGGKAIGFIETLTSAKSVVNVNQSRSVTTITTRDRRSGQVKTETFFGTLPFLRNRPPSQISKSCKFPNKTEDSITAAGIVTTSVATPRK